jgi:[protein-PII] uridylyltransferase
MFHIADVKGVDIHPNALRTVTRSLDLITDDVRSNPVANQAFLEVLTSRHDPERALRLMNEAGVLGRFVPEFGHAVGLMQFNMYHHYTVDEHLIRAVGNVAAIERGDHKDTNPLTSDIVKRIKSRNVLYCAILLHDMAKGLPGDHSDVGAEIARSLCPRLGLSAADTQSVAWLVKNHLVMSDTAQRRDVSDPKTVRDFVDQVQTPEMLRLLVILTVADIRAVGPGVWNGWKGQLLRTLYWETEVVLAGGHSAIDRKQRVLNAQNELRKALATWSDPDFEDYANRHYPAYWLKVDLPHKVAHAKLLHLADVEVKSLLTEYSTDAFRGITELTVLAPDHPRLALARRLDAPVHPPPRRKIAQRHALGRVHRPVRQQVVMLVRQPRRRVEPVARAVPPREARRRPRPRDRWAPIP